MPRPANTRKRLNLIVMEKTKRTCCVILQQDPGAGVQVGPISSRVASVGSLDTVVQPAEISMIIKGRKNE